MRRRWAWITAIIFAVVSGIIAAIGGGPGITWAFYNGVPLILLLSPPMRAYVVARKH